MEKVEEAAANAKRRWDVNEVKRQRDERNGGTNRRRTREAMGGRLRRGRRGNTGGGKVTFPEK